MPILKLLPVRRSAIAGPEFGELQGHLMIIYKALWPQDLWTPLARRFSAVLRDMGFIPCYADPDVWMRDKETTTVHRRL
jgi:hypothetical protein